MAMATKGELFAGLTVALVTPFRDGQIDFPALLKLVDWHVEQGTDCLAPVGTTGESPTLDHEEHERVIAAVCERARGRIKVMPGTGSNSTREALRLTKFAKKAGATGALMVGPYYNKPTQEGYYRHFAAVAEAVDLPIVIYNVPGRTGSNILPDTQLRLAEIPNLLGVKEASGDISQIGEICARAPRKFRIFSGDDALTLPVIALGGHGIISVASNEVPGMMAKFTEACLDGRRDEARDWNRKLYPLLKANFIETSPIPVKAALAMKGKITEAYRLPLVNISDGNRSKLASVLTDLKLIDE